MSESNFCIVDDYLNSLDLLDALELIEAIDIDRFTEFYSKNKEASDYLLEVLRCPELLHANDRCELSEAEKKEAKVYLSMFIFQCRCGETDAFNQVLASCVMIKNRKIDSPEKEQLVLDTVARVKSLDEAFFNISVSAGSILLPALGKDGIQFSRRAAACVHLLVGLYCKLIDVLKALYRSMPQWWAIGKTVMNDIDDIDYLKTVAVMQLPQAIVPDDDKAGRERIKSLARANKGLEESFLDLYQPLMKRHYMLLDIALPPALIAAVPNLEGKVPKLPAATNKKINKDFLERFREANAGSYKFYLEVD